MQTMTLGEAQEKLIQAESEIQKDTPQFRISEIDCMDDQVISLLQRGDTAHIPYISAPGIRDLLRRTKVSQHTVRDILALYRLGALESGLADVYLDKSRFGSCIHWGNPWACLELLNLWPSIQSVLENTYGVPLYREQLEKLIENTTGCSSEEAAEWVKSLVGNISKEERKVIERSILKSAKKNETPEKIIRELLVLFKRQGGTLKQLQRESFIQSYAEIAYRFCYLSIHYSDSIGGEINASQ
ncbi:hypothetical protein FE236_02955 [Mariprofundus erugo]|uniref:hypothetical protein n=1 Tax=Mariprofundus erugo TaxID=2528639 RepID=UPI0010FDE546|nr:hypothetical protein [Mariprofundus erugo]TLS77581.1 hypothetical protein FE236_02955 [Mariprofundus erugo]